jgi:hypothetical protein
MRMANCIICTDEVITSNTKDGICKNCWYKIDIREAKTFDAYMKIDTTLETFPKQRGRFLT